MIKGISTNNNMIVNFDNSNTIKSCKKDIEISTEKSNFNDDLIKTNYQRVH